MTTHSSTLAWKILWTEEPGGLQSMGSLRVGHDWVTSLSCIGEANGNPLQCSCLENPRDGGAWWAAVYGVTQSWTRLKWLSSSSSSIKLFPLKFSSAYFVSEPSTFVFLFCVICLFLSLRSPVIHQCLLYVKVWSTKALTRYEDVRQGDYYKVMEQFL